jgi:hypothetical protein
VATAIRPEVLFREVNCAIENVHLDFGPGVVPEFLCECGGSLCAARIRATIAEFERVSRRLDRFLVAPGHERFGCPFRVIARNERYVIVELLDKPMEDERPAPKLVPAPLPA